MKKLLITFFLSAIFVLIASGILSNMATVEKPRIVSRPEAKKNLNVNSATFAKLKLKAADARSFVQKNGFNERLCFLLDMSLSSGQKRFFIYDLMTDSLRSGGLVTHGNCNQSWLEGRKFDNTIGSGCTSLGKYKIGKPYHGKFGLAYKLNGLDKTNNNAFSRFVVLHSHDCVPDEEVEDEICQSLGCPTVSPAYLKQLEKIINASKKPILLWIYN